MWWLQSFVIFCARKQKGPVDHQFINGGVMTHDTLRTWLIKLEILTWRLRHPESKKNWIRSPLILVLSTQIYFNFTEVVFWRSESKDQHVWKKKKGTTTKKFGGTYRRGKVKEKEERIVLILSRLLVCFTCVYYLKVYPLSNSTSFLYSDNSNNLSSTSSLCNSTLNSL